MSFKEQLAKHENILNRFKALYINNENQNKNSINDKSSNIEMNNSENLVTEQDIVNKPNYSNINTNSNNYNFSYGNITNGRINYSKNNDNNYDYNNNKEKSNIFENKKELVKKDVDKDLGKIDNLLDKLNFKRENNINNESISMEKYNINNNKEDIISNNSKKFDIGSIKSKYKNNDINEFNVVEKYYNPKKEDKNILSINDIKKYNKLNARSEIERIKSKYYSMNLNNIINKKNYLRDDLFPNNNKDNYNIQLNKDILEIKNKIELYKNEFKNISLLSQKDLKDESISIKEENEKSKFHNINENSKNISIINKNDILNNENNQNQNLNKVIENGNSQINIPNLNFKYSIPNNLEKFDNNSRKEIDVEINSYENSIINNINNNNNQQEINEINEIQNNNMNMNGIISEIRINSNNQMMNNNNNDFDYSDVLPIIDKVSKLKDLNDIDENFEKQKTNDLNIERINITNSNINNLNSNEDEEVPNIVNSILDALSNKKITNNIENNQNNDINNQIEKPKLINKNNNFEDKKNKIISFKEFLEKEENK